MTKAGKKHYSPTPLDFLILEALPDQGILGGVHWAGKPLKYVREAINRDLPDGAEPLPMTMIQSRVRAMKVAGHVTDYASHGRGRVWARTPDGADFLSRREAILNG